MDLSADQQAKVAEAKKAIAALDCQTIFKALIQEALSKLAGALCPQSKEAPNA
jgi:ABC-type methionine transport system permease subunit